MPPRNELFARRDHRSSAVRSCSFRISCDVVRSRRCRRSPGPPVSPHPIPAIPIWRRLQRFWYSDQCHPCRSVVRLVLGFQFPDYQITQLPNPGRGHPPVSPHPIPLIPIWRRLQHSWHSDQCHPCRSVVRLVLGFQFPDYQITQLPNPGRGPPGFTPSDPNHPNLA
jgi:hypothetical protein